MGDELSSKRKHGVRIGIGIMFVGAGIFHFTDAAFFESLVPAQSLANRATINIVTGVLTTVIGIAFILPRLRAVARWVALTLLVVTLPVTTYRALHPAAAKSMGLSPALFGFALIAWLLMIVLVWWTTKPDRLSGRCGS